MFHTLSIDQLEVQTTYIVHFSLTFFFSLWSCSSCNFSHLESPKHQGKPNVKSGKGYGVSYAPSQPLKGRNIVVVSQKSMLDEGEEDSEILTLGV